MSTSTSAVYNSAVCDVPTRTMYGRDFSTVNSYWNSSIEHHKVSCTTVFNNSSNITPNPVKIPPFTSHDRKSFNLHAVSEADLKLGSVRSESSPTLYMLEHSLLREPSVSSTVVSVDDFSSSPIGEQSFQCTSMTRTDQRSFTLRLPCIRAVGTVLEDAVSDPIDCMDEEETDTVPNEVIQFVSESTRRIQCQLANSSAERGSDLEAVDHEAHLASLCLPVLQPPSLVSSHVSDDLRPPSLSPEVMIDDSDDAYFSSSEKMKDPGSDVSYNGHHQRLQSSKLFTDFSESAISSNTMDDLHYFNLKEVASNSSFNSSLSTDESPFTGPPDVVANSRHLYSADNEVISPVTLQSSVDSPSGAGFPRLLYSLKTCDHSTIRQVSTSYEFPITEQAVSEQTVVQMKIDSQDPFSSLSSLTTNISVQASLSSDADLKPIAQVDSVDVSATFSLNGVATSPLRDGSSFPTSVTTCHGIESVLHGLPQVVIGHPSVTSASPILGSLSLPSSWNSHTPSVVDSAVGFQIFPSTSSFTSDASFLFNSVSASCPTPVWTTSMSPYPGPPPHFPPHKSESIIKSDTPLPVSKETLCEVANTTQPTNEAAVPVSPISLIQPNTRTLSEYSAPLHTSKFLLLHTLVKHGLNTSTADIAFDPKLLGTAGLIGLSTTPLLYRSLPGPPNVLLIPPFQAAPTMSSLGLHSPMQTQASACINVVSQQLIGSNLMSDNRVLSVTRPQFHLGNDPSPTANHSLLGGTQALSVPIALLASPTSQNLILSALPAATCFSSSFGSTVAAISQLAPPVSAGSCSVQPTTFSNATFPCLLSFPINQAASTKLSSSKDVLVGTEQELSVELSKPSILPSAENLLSTRPQCSSVTIVNANDPPDSAAVKPLSVDSTAVPSAMSNCSTRRRHQCPFCPKSCERKDNLQAHIRTHTGERPYPCRFCPKAFPQKDHLRAHIRTHTGEKPYRCPQCFKAFAQLGNLHRHVKTHRR